VHARAVYASHTSRSISPERRVRIPLRVRLAIILAEVREWRLHRCLVCGRISLRLRPAKPDMPRAWVRTWVCQDRAACATRLRYACRIPVDKRRGVGRREARSGRGLRGTAAAAPAAPASRPTNEGD
jgi:hypothetical protein